MERDSDKIRIKESGQEPYKTCLSGFPTFLANLPTRLLCVIWNTGASVISAGGRSLERLPWSKDAVPFHQCIKASGFCWVFFGFFSCVECNYISKFFPKPHYVFYSFLSIWLGKYNGHSWDIPKLRKWSVWGYITTLPKMHTDCFWWPILDIWKIPFC